MRDLGVPASYFTAAAAINNAGMVVGNYYDRAIGYRGFVWTQSGGLQDLGNLGTPFVTAYAINSFGEAVGRAVNPQNNTNAGFWWTSSGGMKALPSFRPDEEALAFAINSSGEVVGSGFNYEKLQSFAIVWPGPTSVYDLNDLTVNSSMILEEAEGVNSLGVIVGIGKLKGNPAASHAFLATPVQ
jgi:uncharacterized membrane protein